jgi:pyruvate,water dikinase
MDRRVTIVPLAAATDESRFGAKAVNLGAAIRAGLPVPPGLALAADAVIGIAEGHAGAAETLIASEYLPGGRLAVRSSAIGEDSSGASFAGQHATRLNVLTHAQLLEAIRFVSQSAHTVAALAYRSHQGLAPEPRMAVVVQAMVDPVAAGVLFTRNPVTGADERLIESTWGLGEAVVSGAVVPDRFVLDQHGSVIDRAVGDKDIKIAYGDAEGTVEVPVPDDLRRVPSLTDDQVATLHDLAERCRAVWGPDLDLEWALDSRGEMYLLQSRPITTLR